MFSALKLTWALQNLFKPVRSLLSKHKQLFSSGLLRMHLKYPQQEAEALYTTSEAIFQKMLSEAFN